MSSPVDPSWLPPLPSQRVGNLEPPIAPEPPVDFSPTAWPPPQPGFTTTPMPNWAPPSPDQRVNDSAPSGEPPVEPTERIEPAAPPPGDEFSGAYVEAPTLVEGSMRPTSLPSQSGAPAARRWRAWHLVAVAVVVGVVAGAAATVAITHTGHSDHTATPSPVAADDSLPPVAASAPPPAVAPTQAAAGCGVNLADPRVVAAVQQLAPYPEMGWKWNADPATFEGNYNPCSTLSTVLATVEMATGGSPVTALMFHNGDYLGTATLKAYPFTTLNAAQTTGDTVVLDYKQPGACTACPPAGITSVRYQWQSDHVEMLDPPPGSPEAVPNVAGSGSHEVTTHIEWSGPQNFIEFNWPLLTDHRQIVKGKVPGNQVNLVQRAVSGDYFGADPIIGDNAYVSCVVTVDGREVLRDAAARGDGHDCNCLRVMP